MKWYEKGRLYTGFDKSVRRHELATVETRYAATTESRESPLGEGEAWYTGSSTQEGLYEGISTFGTFHELPDRTTTYYWPDGVRWHRQFREFDFDPNTGDLHSRLELGTSPKTFRAGRTYREAWNAGVFGPGFPATDARLSGAGTKPWAGRTGDHLSTDLPLFTDRYGHPGFSKTDKAETTLERDGRKLAESDKAGVIGADLPADEATYRLATTATRHSLGGVSTEVSAAWTFKSGHGTTALPLSAVRFHPSLDDENRAAAGQAWIPVTVQRQPGSRARAVAALGVEVSYDDGKSWQRAAVRRAGPDRWQAQVAPTAGATHVSLRAASSDHDGNTVEQTIIRAYGLR